MEKKIITSIMVLIVAAIAALVFGKIYANYKFNEKIVTVNESFKDAKSEDKKIEILKSWIKNKEIKNLRFGSDYFEVSTKYEESINSMQEYFYKEYLKEIESCSVHVFDVTKDELITAINELYSVQDKIKKNSSCTLEKTAREYLENYISVSIDSYSHRYGVIDEEMKIAAKKAAEAEAKSKAAEAEAKAWADARIKANSTP